MNKIVSKIKKDNENGARRSILEEIFYDFNRSRAQVYKINFTRGLFFGFGSVIGGTLVVGIIVWLLSLFVDLPGGVGSFIQYIVDIVKHR
jgi:hypothetical protein